MSNAPKLHSLRILLTEGSSTSAREAVTLLGLFGHHVEVCDPGRIALARFSKHVRAWHRCPGLRDDPIGFRDFVVDLVSRREFDVVLPIHEQGLALATIRSQLNGVVLPSFKSYRIAHGKADFSRLLNELALSQPATRIVSNPYDLRAAIHYPCVIKTAIGTASCGVWFIRSVADVPPMLAALDGYVGEILVQDWADGALEKAQAVFSHGTLLGFHAYRQLSEGAGGGDAMKESVVRQRVRDDVAIIGRALRWHGALSVDYILSVDGVPRYIDCNPRLVEAMSAHLAGVDLMGSLLKVSVGEVPEPLPDGRAGVLSHQAMQVLLGSGMHGGNRRDIMHLGLRLIWQRGPFTDSIEELTPWRDDSASAIPLAMVALALLLSPRLAKPLARSGWGAHLLNEASVAEIVAHDRTQAAIGGDVESGVQQADPRQTEPRPASRAMSFPEHE